MSIQNETCMYITRMYISGKNIEMIFRGESIYTVLRENISNNSNFIDFRVKVSR